MSMSDGSTRLDPDAAAGLIPNLVTHAELNEFEARNILMAEIWASSHLSEKDDILVYSNLIKLHCRMFNMTWKRAGKLRRYDTNIGVSSFAIQQRLLQLCDNIRFRIQVDQSRLVEIASDFHYELVVIHAFPNGNGRHARLATDILLLQHGKARFTWGSTLVVDNDVRRERYIQALRLADIGDFNALYAFVVS
jgi:Fic-DOC domain mobile mystery protein B